MRLMVELYARQLFFPFFFTKKNKRQARAKNDVVFILFILLVKKLLLRPDAILLFPFSYDMRYLYMKMGL